jgi:CCR4-NOT transcriptional regulation complex NOT5 subunit
MLQTTKKETTMTNTIKSNEGLSNGHIFDPEKKKKQSETIQEQIEEFLKAGGQVEDKGGYK